MPTQPLEQAIATTRSVLTGVSKDQLGTDTPCAAWKVSDLINHIVGGQYFFESCAKGEAPASGDLLITPPATSWPHSSRPPSAASPRSSAPTASWRRSLTLPFGQMPGVAFCGIAATDTFTHGWDLAKATGQDTNLNDALAGQLLLRAKLVHLACVPLTRRKLHSGRSSRHRPARATPISSRRSWVAPSDRLTAYPRAQAAPAETRANSTMARNSPSVSGRTDKRFPLASNRQSGEVRDRAARRATPKGRLRTGATVTQSQRGSSGLLAGRSTSCAGRTASDRARRS